MVIVVIGEVFAVVAKRTFYQRSRVTKKSWARKRANGWREPLIVDSPGAFRLR